MMLLKHHFRFNLEFRIHNFISIWIDGVYRSIEDIVDIQELQKSNLFLSQSETKRNIHISKKVAQKPRIKCLLYF